MKPATWPIGPDIRGRDLIRVGALGAAGVGVLIAALFLLDWLDAGPLFSDSGAELGTDPGSAGARDILMIYALIAMSYFYFAMVVYVILVRPNRQNWQDLGFRRFDLKWLAVAAAVGVVLFVAGELLVDALGFREQAEAYNRDMFFVNGANFLTITAEILLIGPATGVIEEICFRGLLHRWIRQKLDRISGTAISAAIFSLVHFAFYDPGGILGFYWTMEIVVFGAMLALLLEWSGSLWPPIVLHAANNTVAVALAHIGG